MSTIARILPALVLYAFLVAIAAIGVSVVVETAIGLQQAF